MSPRPSKFRQSDVTRALKAARAAGLEVAKFEISSEGSIVITNSVGHLPTFTPESVVPSGLAAYERWKAKRDEKSK
jgi:hypothetical protein